MKETLTILAIGLMATQGSNSYGQAPNATMPKDMQYLMELAGSWEGPAVMKADGKEQRFQYYADFRKTASNSGMEMYEHADVPGMGKMTGTNLIGFDPFDNKIHWYSVDNIGTTHEHTGNFSDHDHFKMVHKSMREGKEYVETLDMVRKSKDKLSIKLVATMGGREDEVIMADFQRKGGKTMAAK